MKSSAVLRHVNRLSMLLQQPGGISVAAAVEAAEQGLAELSDDCLEAVDELLGDIDAILVSERGLSTAGAAGEIYKLVDRMIGLATSAGYPDFDRVAHGFCDLLDWMRAGDRWDGGAVQVHVHALHYLRNQDNLRSRAAISELTENLSNLRSKKIGSY